MLHPVLREKRRGRRIDINSAFQDVDPSIPEYARNLSESGVFIKSVDPYPVGTDVSLKFTLILDELETFEALGKIVRVVAPGMSPVPGMGVKFLDLPARSCSLIEEVLSKDTE